MLVTPRSRQSMPIVLGPRLGICSSGIRPGGHARRQLFVVGAAAGLDVLLDDLLAARADALDVAERALLVALADVDRSCLQQPADLPEGDGLEHALALDLHQGGHGRKELGQFVVE